MHVTELWRKFNRLMLTSISELSSVYKLLASELTSWLLSMCAVTAFFFLYPKEPERICSFFALYVTSALSVASWHNLLKST